MRNKRLDVLRCVAILFVILEHGHIVDFFTRTGWIGVDLFFVLSGFLISGLLFGEYRKRGAIDVKRFYIRRGFKIYPSFYVFLAFTAVIQYVFLHLAPLAAYLHEIFFVQNYLGGVYGHTWSLGVEEQFYIVLPAFLIALIRFSPRRSDPFQYLPGAFLLVAVLCQASRAVSAFVGQPNYTRVYYATHNRIDALFFGVLIGYFLNFHPEKIEQPMRRAWVQIIVGVLSIAFLSCAYWFDRETWFFGAIGYVLIYLGCGGILLLSLFVHNVLPRVVANVVRPIGTVMARVGMYSYSIYLWHGAVAGYLVGRVRTVLHLSLGPTQTFFVFLVESLVVGIGMSIFIEYPFLQIRNRLFPSASEKSVRSADNSMTELLPQDLPVSAPQHLSKAIPDVEPLP